MKQRLQHFIISALFFSAGCLHPNVLSKTETEKGWQLLFDGKTTTGWRGAYQNEFPKQGWMVKNSSLKGQLSKGAESGDAGDIVSLKKYKNFELLFEWKLGKGGNSGVKYFIEERQPRPIGSQSGYEYQLIDDANYIYNGKKLDDDLKTASLYDVLPSQKADSRMGNWHRSRIFVKNNLIQHWLDDKKVLEVDRNSDLFLKSVRESKFKDYKGFESISEGYILLQDHGHNVAFRNIKIREL